MRTEPGPPAIAGLEPSDTAQAAPARWPGFPLLPNGRFPIAGWCAPPVRETSDARYAEYAGAGFTVVLPALEDPYQLRTNLDRLEVARRHDLFVVIRDTRVHGDEAYRPGWRDDVDQVVAAYSKHPALLAYFLADEPQPIGFPSLAVLTRRFAARDSLHPALVNLLGAPKGSYQGLSFSAYLRRFRDLVQPALFAFDQYPLEEKGDAPDLFAAPDTVRATAGPAAYWQVLQLTPHGPYRPLTESEMRWQANLALAWGARGIVWFTYWTPNPAEALHYRDGPIAYDGSRNPTYERITRVNRELEPLGQELSALRLVTVAHTGRLPLGGSALPMESRMRAEGGDLTVALFRGQSHDHALIVNRDHDHSVAARIDFAPPAGPANRWARKPGIYEKRSRTRFSLVLAPGGAELFRCQGPLLGAEASPAKAR